MAWVRHRKPLLAGAAAFVAAAAFADDSSDASGEPELYRWLDRGGVVRYTPDLDRVPDTRRNTAIRVVPGTTPRGEPMAATAVPKTDPKAAASSTPPEVAPSTPSTVPALAGADPFNAPAELRNVESEWLTTEPGLGAHSWPELEARIAELEVLIEADEEIIKDMLSAPPAETSDDLIHSPVLRQIAARLPILQGELIELRRWREQPRNR